MLISLLMMLSVGAGFAQAPWWFWLVGGAALAFLSLTDPFRFRPAYVPGAGGALLMTSFVSLTMGCSASAFAFALGRMVSWALPA